MREKEDKKGWMRRIEIGNEEVKERKWDMKKGKQI